MSTLKKLVVSCVWCALVILASVPHAFAQEDCPVPSGAERQQQLARLLETLNSPDPTATIPLFEAVMQGCDATMRRLALRTALQSDDPVLQELAVAGLMASASSILVSIEIPEGTNNGYTDTFMASTGGGIEVLISEFDGSTGEFSTQVSGTEGDEPSGRGAVQGRRISFNVDASPIYSAAGICRGFLSSGADNITLEGRLACEYNIDLIASTTLLE